MYDIKCKCGAEVCGEHCFETDDGYWICEDCKGVPADAKKARDE